MNTQSYGAFSQSLHQRYFGERAPLEVSIEVTRRCPLECKHCYNNFPMGDVGARNRELTKEEHFQLLDQLVAVGAFWLLYSGGEIFARKDFLGDAARRVSTIGFLQHYCSNPARRL